jgi:cell division protein FtsL
MEPMEIGDFIEAFLVMFGKAVLALLAAVVLFGIMAIRALYKETKEFRRKKPNENSDY